MAFKDNKIVFLHFSFHCMHYQFQCLPWERIWFLFLNTYFCLCQVLVAVPRLSLVAVRGLLIVIASLVAENRLQSAQAQQCGECA